MKTRSQARCESAPEDWPQKAARPSRAPSAQHERPPSWRSGRLRILMVSDFFYPNFGGVENHIYELSQCLLHLGHHIVVMTHAYDDRIGVRYVTNGLKVYYVPRRPFYANATMPTVFGAFRLLRNILLRERIQLVHGHQAFSVLAHEALLHARTMGYPVTFTDHSLFGFADAASICTNKVLKWCLADVQTIICVSHTSKENTVLRACLPPDRVFVIPNAVDTSKFQPLPRPPPPPNIVTIVMLNRLVYRKGIDLQAVIVPILCRGLPVRFIIGGDGPMRGVLEAMIEQHALHEQVQLVGSLQHEAARNLLVTGDIFLNTSLTEAFCMAIVEAAACGLLVVSTNVGGVPEVLPESMRLLADPAPADLVKATREAVRRVQRRPVDRQAQHDQVASMYNWGQVAERTLHAYQSALAKPCDGHLGHRVGALVGSGRIFGLIAVCMASLDMLWYRLVRWLDPEQEIEVCRDFPSAKP